METACSHALCACSSKSSAYSQSLDEMDFERGLWQASLDGNTQRVKSLLAKGGDPNERDASGYTALHYASRSGHDDVCELLIQHGANVDAQTKSSKATALHRAAYCGHAAVIRCLVKHGADLKLCDADGKIALHKAAEKIQKEVITILLDLDPDLVRAIDNNGRIPADCVPHNHPEMITLLSPN